jgi:Na+/H+ antiporter NhaB
MANSVVVKGALVVMAFPYTVVLTLTELLAVFIGFST